MRKHIIDREGSPEHDRLDLERLASVEITSEDPAHPIERALRGEGGGWRASSPGEQIIRLIFDEPAQVRAISLRFDERETPRTQQFVLAWSSDRGWSYREIVRQQYTFSPPGTVSEIERYTVELAGVTELELRLIPDIGGGPAIATLGRLQVA